MTAPLDSICSYSIHTPYVIGFIFTLLLLNSAAYYYWPAEPETQVIVILNFWLLGTALVGVISLRHLCSRTSQ